MRKASLEGRGLSVVTASGTIVTLLFGLVAVLTAGKDFVLPDLARDLLLVALIGFGVAWVLGVLSNIPLNYQNVDIEDGDFWRWWGEPNTKGFERIAATRLGLLRVAQRKNDIKGKVVIWAVAAEVLAVVALAGAVGVVLVRG